MTTQVDEVTSPASYGCSIVVPTRNRAGLLRDTLDDLARQVAPGVRCEILVVDDGSTDDTPRVVKDAQASSPHDLRYVRQAALGPNPARNRGVREARADLVWFIDDDVALPSGWLRAVVEGTRAVPQAPCLGGPIRLRLEGPAPRLCRPGRENGFGETVLDEGPDPGPVEHVWGANFGIRRAAYDRIGPFDETLGVFGDETEWQLRLGRDGGVIHYLPDAAVWHRRTAETLRLRNLCRAQFRRGIHLVRFYRVTDQEVRMLPNLVNVGRMLVHAGRRRCAYGLISASRSSGHAWGQVLEWRAMSWSRRPT